MTIPQQIIVILYSLLNILVFLKGLYEIKYKKNAYGLASLFSFIGIFVWGDAIIIGPFFLIICSVIIFLQDWYLFLVTLSLFWVVRSPGEIAYWICEQFSDKHRNPPQTLKFYKFINNDSIWFIYQLFWQCILALSLLASIYSSSLWLRSL